MSASRAQPAHSNSTGSTCRWKVSRFLSLSRPFPLSQVPGEERDDVTAVEQITCYVVTVPSPGVYNSSLAAPLGALLLPLLCQRALFLSHSLALVERLPVVNRKCNPLPFPPPEHSPLSPRVFIWLCDFAYRYILVQVSLERGRIQKMPVS